MKKIIVYGSHLWGGCPKVKEYLSKKEVKFAYFDVSLQLGALARFLKIRDTNPVFESVKESGSIGLPTILIDDEILVGFDEEKLEKLL